MKFRRAGSGPRSSQAMPSSRATRRRYSGHAGFVAGRVGGIEAREFRQVRDDTSAHPALRPRRPRKRQEQREKQDPHLRNIIALGRVWGCGGGYRRGGRAVRGRAADAAGAGGQGRGPGNGRRLRRRRGRRVTWAPPEEETAAEAVEAGAKRRTNPRPLAPGPRPRRAAARPRPRRAAARPRPLEGPAVGSVSWAGL